jgi:hypothetical protein
MLPNRNLSKNPAEGSTNFLCEEHIWDDQGTRCHVLEDCRLCEKSNFEGSKLLVYVPLHISAGLYRPIFGLNKLFQIIFISMFYLGGGGGVGEVPLL